MDFAAFPVLCRSCQKMLELFGMVLEILEPCEDGTGLN